jgi:hypothetical protein
MGNKKIIDKRKSVHVDTHITHTFTLFIATVFNAENTSHGGG